MNDLAQNYGIPTELMRFVDNGMLDVVSTDPDRKTVHFTVPSLRSADDQNRVTIYSVTWIHSDFNAQHCHYFHETPGDLANFYVTRETMELADEMIDNLNSVDELVAWLDGIAAQP